MASPSQKFWLIVARMWVGTALIASAKAQTLKIDTVAVAPFGFYDQKGKPQGMMYEIGNRIAEVADIPYKNTIVPYARSGQDIGTGAADFCLRFSSPEMEKYALQLIPILSVPIISISARGTNYSTMADLSGKSVGIIRSSTFDAKFNSDPTIRRYEVNDYVQMIKMLEAGRLDAAAGSTIGLYYSAKTANIDLRHFASPFVLSRNTFVLNFSRRSKRPETVAALRAAVTKLTSSGEINMIVDKYMGSHDWALEYTGERRNQRD